MSALDAHPSASLQVGVADGSSLTRDNTATGVGAGLQPLPGPDGTHRGWEATTVSTAKCDMCHKQRCGTIQKCSECKLSVCMDCAVADRLRADARHSLDPAAVDWTASPAPSKLRTLRAPRNARAAGGLRRGAARSLRTRARARRRQLPPRPAPSRAKSTSFSSTVSPPIHVVSPALDDGDDDTWDQGYDCWADEGELALQPDDEAAVLHRRPVNRATKPSSPVSEQTAQTENAAEILVQMPCHRPRSAAEQQRSHRPHGPAQGVLLPPVHPFLVPRQSGLLPPLRTLHPRLGVENAQVQPLILGSTHLLLPRTDSSRTCTSDGDITEDMQHEEDGISSYEHYRTQGYSTWGAQPHSYAHPMVAATHCHESGEPRVYSSFLPASTALYPPQMLPAAPRASNWEETFADYAYGSYLPPRHEDRFHTHGPSTGYYAAGYQPTTRASQAGAYDYVSTPTGAPHGPPRPAVEEQGAALRSSALEIQAAEHPDWPLDRCLQLALARTWAQRGSDEPRNFLELRAAAYAAALDLDLPERHNAVRTWLCEQQHTLGDGGAAWFPALHGSLPLGFFGGLAERADGE